MGVYRCFVETADFSAGDEVEIGGDEFHHVRGVLRLEVGESLSLANGRGLLAEGVVIELKKKSCVVRVVSVTQVHSDERRLTLGLALLKGGHLDLAIEKGTELGVDRFVIFRAERSERCLVTPAIHRRIEAMITAAMKQCGRLFRPEVCIADDVKQAVDAMGEHVVWTDLGAKKWLGEALLSIEGSVGVLIGPEAGWSESERRFLREKSEPVLLHRNVLRAETAAIVASYACALKLK